MVTILLGKSLVRQLGFPLICVGLILEAELSTAIVEDCQIGNPLATLRFNRPNALDISMRACTSSLLSARSLSKEHEGIVLEFRHDRIVSQSPDLAPLLGKLVLGGLLSNLLLLGEVTTTSDIIEHFVVPDTGWICDMVLVMRSTSRTFAVIRSWRTIAPFTQPTHQGS